MFTYSVLMPSSVLWQNGMEHCGGRAAGNFGINTIKKWYWINDVSLPLSKCWPVPLLIQHSSALLDRDSFSADRWHSLDSWQYYDFAKCTNSMLLLKASSEDTQGVCSFNLIHQVGSHFSWVHSLQVTYCSMIIMLLISM